MGRTGERGVPRTAGRGGEAGDVGDAVAGLDAGGSDRLWGMDKGCVALLLIVAEGMVLIVVLTVITPILFSL